MRELSSAVRGAFLSSRKGNRTRYVRANDPDFERHARRLYEMHFWGSAQAVSGASETGRNDRDFGGRARLAVMTATSRNDSETGRNDRDFEGMTARLAAMTTTSRYTRSALPPGQVTLPLSRSR